MRESAEGLIREESQTDPLPRPFIPTSQRLTYATTSTENINRRLKTTSNSIQYIGKRSQKWFQHGSPSVPKSPNIVSIRRKSRPRTENKLQNSENFLKQMSKNALGKPGLPYRKRRYRAEKTPINRLLCVGEDRQLTRRPVCQLQKNWLGQTQINRRG